MEAHHRTGIDRDHDAGARLALFLHHGRADAGAEPACLAVAIAQTADAVVERGEIQDVSRNDAEGEGKLFGGEARRAREADAGDAGGDALLDAKVEGVASNEVTAGASTDEIRAAIHKGRLALFRVFLISLVVAMVLTMLVSTTIVQPIRQLRKDAHEILDARLDNFDDNLPAVMQHRRVYLAD